MLLSHVRQVAVPVQKRGWHILTWRNRNFVRWLKICETDDPFLSKFSYLNIRIPTWANSPTFLYSCRGRSNFQRATHPPFLGRFHRIQLQILNPWAEPVAGWGPLQAAVWVSGMVSLGHFYSLPARRALLGLKPVPHGSTERLRCALRQGLGPAGPGCVWHQAAPATPHTGPAAGTAPWARGTCVLIVCTKCALYSMFCWRVSSCAK